MRWFGHEGGAGAARLDTTEGRKQGARLRVKGEVKGCKRKKMQKKLFDDPSGGAEKIPK